MFERLFHWTGTILATLAGIALVAMMVLTFADVIGRYGFHHSIFGTAEIVEFLMVVTIFAGVAFITATNEHISVTIFDSQIGRWAPNLQRWAIIACSVIVYALIAWQLAEHALDMFGSGKRTAVLNLPQWIQPATGALLSVIGVVLLVSAVVRSNGRPETLRDDASPVGSGAE
ncbi:MAG: TRAP transporter small permease [Burkholderiaceae bacterium]